MAGALSGATVLRVLRMTLHAGFFVLLGVAVTRAVLELGAGAGSYAALLGALLLAAVYCAGPLLLRTRRPAQVWLATTTALWAALLGLSPDFAWVAFPLFFVHLHLLRRVHGVVAVGVITAAVIAAQALHYGQLTVGMVLGPLLGAAFAVVIALGYATLYTENTQHRRLIDDLTRTRSELAASQHHAGALAERERLAREIHDTLTQGLSSIVLLLRSAEAALPATSTTPLARITEARQTASDNLAEARRFVRDLSSPSLAGRSLAEALHRLCERTGRDAGVDCRFHLDGEPTALPPGYEVTLLRAAQSSLANVAAHAHAHSAVVTLGFLETEVTLDIFDDGIGFDPATAVHPRGDDSGYGLPGLRGRVQAIGGQFDIESTPGEGTVIAIRLPLATRTPRPQP